MADRVLEIITRYSMLTAGDRVGVAVSGGADSVCLLHLLQPIAEQLGVSLVVLHCNHELRGVDSDRDEAFVRKLADQYKLPFLSRRYPPDAGNLEEQARLARRRLWAEARIEVGLSRIALGHTRSDQAETLLFRFVRGSGTVGLAGMPFVSADGLIRPLLEVGRDEIRSWLQSENISWREDESNADTRLQRNRLRLDIMPQLRTLNSNLEGVLAGMAGVAQAENQYWDALLSDVCPTLSWRSRFGICLSASGVMNLHRALARRVIRQAAGQVRGDLRAFDLQHVEEVLRICGTGHGHDRVMCPGLDAMRSFDTLLLALPGVLSQPRHYTVTLEVGRHYCLPHGAGEISLQRVNLSSLFCVNFKEDPRFSMERVELDEARLRQTDASCSLSIRNWEPGDTIERAGRTRPEKLKTLFQDRRVYLWERKHWPVLAFGSEVVWTRAFGAASRFQATPESREVLQLQYADVSEERRFEVRV